MLIKSLEIHLAPSLELTQSEPFPTNIVTVSNTSPVPPISETEPVNSIGPKVPSERSSVASDKRTIDLKETSSIESGVENVSDRKRNKKGSGGTRRLTSYRPPHPPKGPNKPKMSKILKFGASWG